MAKTFEQFFKENANVGGVLGGPSSTSAFSGDTYAPTDARVVKPLFKKKKKKHKKKSTKAPDFVVSRRTLPTGL